MCIIQNNFEGIFIKNIHAPRCLEECSIKGAQPMTNVIQRLPHAVSECCGEHCVLYVVNRFSFQSSRNQVCPEQRYMRALVVHGDHVTIETFFQHNCSAFCADMFTYQRMIVCECDVTDIFCFCVICHFQTKVIVCVEHSGISGNFNENTLNTCQLLHSIYSSKSKMIT